MRKQDLKKNKLLYTGVLLNAGFLVVRSIEAVPEFMKGILCGVAVSSMLLGVWEEQYGYGRIKKWKKSLLSKMKSK